MYGRSYSMKEMRTIVDYVNTRKAYGEIRGRKLWTEFASSNFTDRTWQSLKETFLKRILPDIHNPYYGLSTAEICSFKHGYDIEIRNKSKLEIETISDDSNNDHGGNVQDNEKPSTSNKNEADNYTGEKTSSSVDARTRASTETIILDNCYETAEDIRRDLESPKNKKDTDSHDGKETPCLRDLITYAEPFTPMMQQILDDFTTEEELVEAELEILEKSDKPNEETTSKSNPKSEEEGQLNKNDVEMSIEKEASLSEVVPCSDSIKIPLAQESKAPGNNSSDLIENGDLKDDTKKVDNITYSLDKKEKDKDFVDLTGDTPQNTNNSTDTTIPGNQEALKNKDEITEPSKISETSKDILSKSTVTRNRSFSLDTKPTSEKKKKLGLKSKNVAQSETDDKSVSPQKPNLLGKNKGEDRKQTTNNVEIIKDKEAEGIEENAYQINPCLNSVSLYDEQFNNIKYTDSDSSDNLVINTNVDVPKEKQDDKDNNIELDKQKDTEDKNKESLKALKKAAKINNVVILKSHSESGESNFEDIGNNQVESNGNQKKSNDNQIESNVKQVNNKEREKALANVFGFSSGVVSSSRKRRISRLHRSPSYKHSNASNSSEWTSESDTEYVSPPRGRRNRYARKYLKPRSSRVLQLEEGGLFVMHGKRIYPLVKDGATVKNYLTFSPESDPEEDSGYWKKKYKEERKKTEELKKLVEASKLKPVQDESPLPAVTSRSSIVPEPIPELITIPDEPKILLPPEKPKLEVKSNEKTLKIKFTKNNEELQVEGCWSQIHPVLADVVQIFSKDPEPAKQVPASNLKGRTNDEPLSIRSTPEDEESVRKKVEKMEEEIFKEIEELEKSEREQEANKKDQEASTKGQEASTKDQKASTKDQEASTKGQEASTMDQKASTKDQEASTKDQEASTKDQEASTKDQKGSSKDQEASTTDQKGSSKDQEASTTDQKGSTKDQEAVTKDQEASTNDQEDNVNKRKRTPRPRKVSTALTSADSSSSPSRPKRAKASKPAENQLAVETKDQKTNELVPEKEIPKRKTRSPKKFNEDSTAVSENPKKLRKSTKKSANPEPETTRPSIDEDTEVRFMFPPTKKTKKPADKSPRSARSSPNPNPTFDNLTQNSIESSQGYQDSDPSPAKEMIVLRRKRKMSLSNILHRTRQRRFVRRRSYPYVSDDASSESSNLSFKLPTKNTSDSIKSEVYRSESYQLLMPVKKRPYTLEKIDEQSPICHPDDTNIVQIQSFDLKNESSDVIDGGNTRSEGNSSHISLPMSPELSIVENISISKELLDSIEDFPTINEMQANNEPNESSDNKYLMSAVDVTMPLMEQDCDIKQSVSPTQRYQPATSESLLNRICSVNIADGPSISDSLDSRLRNLLLESAKKMEVDMLESTQEPKTSVKENVDENALKNSAVNKKSRAKKRCSTPHKKNSKKNSKMPEVDPVVEEECMEFCSYGGRKSCPPVILTEDVGNNENDNMNNVESEPVKKGRKKKDIIKVKILRPSNKQRKVSPAKVAKKKSDDVSTISVHTDSGINETGSALAGSMFLQDTDDSIDLIHNHSETCLQTKECFLDSIEFIERDTSIISINSDEAMCMPPGVFCNNAQDGGNFNREKLLKSQSTETGGSVYFSPLSSERSGNSLITEDLSDENEPPNPRTDKWYLFSDDETTNTNQNPGFGANLMQIFPLTCAVPDLSTITEMSKENDSRKPTLDADGDTRNDLESQSMF